MVVRGKKHSPLVWWANGFITEQIAQKQGTTDAST